MKKILILSASIYLLSSCGNSSKPNEEQGNQQTPKSMLESSSNENPSYDPKRGEGKFTEEGLALKPGLDANMAISGDKIQGVKCASCHKLTDEKLVGPGWKGVTSRRKPEWIMNFITNPDPMIDKDPEVQAQYELCLVRMPDQGLTDDDARHILEFMRQNDAAK
jgi:hypothetical protein